MIEPPFFYVFPMKHALLDYLVCPACLPDEMALACRIVKQTAGDIISGDLFCNNCNTTYPVEEGVASLVAEPGLNPKVQNRYEDPALLASYLWSHYADLASDTDAGHAYEAWAGKFHPSIGLALDAGCAVGRFTFEMANKSDFAIGIDRSHAFIRRARALMKNRTLTFQVPVEGRLQKTLTFNAPDHWESDRIDFIAGDIQALPFRSARFSSVASLNLIDKVPRPLIHLQEMNRVAHRQDAQFLFSDPFSWSESITEAEHWLGGTEDGPFSGRGRDNVMALIQGRGDHMLPPWRIEQKGDLWWKIRTHENYFELIRSYFIKAVR